MLRRDTERIQPDLVISEKLRLHILRRDNWRCQLCGSMRQLEVHHLLFRSHDGQDTEQNLVALCHPCHSALYIAQH
jgi:5-methylcytosine-specific restriction endonuclease McrA